MYSSKPPSLPSELVEEILYKTPVSSLARLKSTCKQWYTLLNTKRFIYKHLDLSHEQFIRTGKDSRIVQIFNPLDHALLDLPLIRGDLYFISTMVHCDGLLLYKCGVGELVVWNPLLKQIKNIKPFTSFAIYGFGYDKLSRGNYKILSYSATANKEIKIYDFKCNVWRSIDANFSYHWFLPPHLPNISMKGNMYWIAKRAADKSKKCKEIFIQSFDFSKETFKPICCVPFETGYFVRNDDHGVIMSGLRGERLSLLHQQKHVGIEVWVTNKVDDEVVSWSKYFNMSLPYLLMEQPCFFFGSVPAYFISKNKNVILWCEGANVGKEHDFYEMGLGKIIKQVETRLNYPFRPCHRACCYVYVPSLVPVP